MADAARRREPDEAGAPPAADPDAVTADDEVDEMELESFPASDPPSTWAGPEVR
jgi:hypothetical protein